MNVQRTGQQRQEVVGQVGESNVEPAHAHNGRSERNPYRRNDGQPDLDISCLLGTTPPDETKVDLPSQ